jgi:hypothetical protein
VRCHRSCSKNEFGGDCASIFALGLSENTALHDLDISCNEFDSGPALLGLASNALSLRSLSLANNRTLSEIHSRVVREPSVRCDCPCHCVCVCWCADNCMMGLFEGLTMKYVRAVGMWCILHTIAWCVCNPRAALVCAARPSRH